MWDIFSKGLNIFLGLWVIYLYLENRKLKGIEIDKNIKLKEIEIKELEQWILKENKKINNELDYLIPGIKPQGIRSQTRIDLEEEYIYKLAKLKAELIFLNRLKYYKWIFSK